MKFLIAIMLLLIIPAASAGYVTSFDSNGIDNKLIAGSVYETESQFTCDKTELTVKMTVEFKDENYPVGNNEWFVRMHLDGNNINCTETSAGVFNSTFDVSAGLHTFIIDFETLPNIMPGEYTVTVYYPDTMITEEEPSHRRAHELWREKWGTSTTHLNDTVESTPIPTEEATEEPEIGEIIIELPFEKVCWILAIISTLIGLTCLAWIWYGRNKD